MTMKTIQGCKSVCLWRNLNWNEVYGCFSLTLQLWGIKSNEKLKWQFVVTRLLRLTTASRIWRHIVRKLRYDRISKFLGNSRNKRSVWHASQQPQIRWLKIWIKIGFEQAYFYGIVYIIQWMEEIFFFFYFLDRKKNRME